jgi:ribosomal protein L22
VSFSEVEIKETRISLNKKEVIEVCGIIENKEEDKALEFLRHLRGKI